ncbi:MAG: extracellular solute-binding protein [Solirubrobacteraceae bacterium]
MRLNSKGRLHRAAAVGAVATLASVAAGCGSSSKSSTSTSGGAKPATSSVSGTISMDGVWSGAEQQAFQDVIKTFNQQYPKVTVNFKSTGDNTPQVLSTGVAGGHPPDMADIAQPGLIQQFATKGALKPITYAASSYAANFGPAWVKLGTFNGKLYGVVFKASNKSTVWYNVASFKTAGVSPPTTWPEFLTDAKTLKASGTPAYSIGGADGWTLTDLFENIYLRQAGLPKYEALSAHKIKWTDPSVKQALTTMSTVLGDTSNIYGGTTGGVQTDFPTSVNNVFQKPPKAAMVMEGDFVPGVATVKAAAGTDYNVFTFPAINGSGPAVEIGGDTIVAFKDTPAIEAFVKFLTTPQAAAAWAKHGGFATGNKNMAASAYPDAITRATAAPVAQASTVVFDMSDEQPGSFGATVGQGEWGLFQDFLRNPKNVSGVAQKLESAATGAYKKGS